MYRKYLLYLLRWQMSTPILALCVVFLANLGGLYSTVVANFIGGLIFFWVDRFIFRPNNKFPTWEVKHEVTCCDCGHVSRGYRLIRAANYDRTDDPNPQYRCEACSQNKTNELLQRGVSLG
jgi:hypothetical protein